MAFDLRAALLRKGEAESARLDDFAFRERARTMRLLAEALDEDAEALVRAIAAGDDAAILARLDQRHAPERVNAAYAQARAQARAALITERGDPAPHRLA